jgi:hypothetical protein
MCCLIAVKTSFSTESTPLQQLEPRPRALPEKLETIKRKVRQKVDHKASGLFV